MCKDILNIQEPNVIHWPTKEFISKIPIKILLGLRLKTIQWVLNNKITALKLKFNDESYVIVGNAHESYFNEEFKFDFPEDQPICKV